MSKLFLRALFPAILAAITGSMYAVDGVILIDQPHALAGGITPGDAPGFPVLITQSGSYRLAGNLTVPDENTIAILIAAPSVSIDLNGFSIIGPVICAGSPPNSAVACAPSGGSGQGIATGGQGAKVVRIFNGTIQGMGSIGIALQFTGVLGDVDNVTLFSNGVDGVETFGKVTKSSATLNGRNGISAGSVLDSIASFNGGTGIGVAFGTTSNSSALNNGGFGISVNAGSVTGNTAVNNGKEGILAVCPSSLIGNTLLGNKPDDTPLLGGVSCAVSNTSPSLP